MNIIGIIIETNPLHNGHKYFIDEIKNKYNPDVLIAVTSTSFTMRGEVSVINKFDKTSALLKAGVNLVLEFPFILSTQSCDYFASNALTILNSIGVNHIICGCENDNIDNFKTFYDLENTTQFINLFKENLKKHNSYKQTFENTLKELNINSSLIELFSKPNFTLAYQYYKTIKYNYPNIQISLIKRTNSYDDENLDSNIVSAKAIRNARIKNLDYSQYLPFDENLIDLNYAYNKLMTLVNYACLITTNYSSTINTEGIINYIINNYKHTTSYDEFINNLCNKRYSKSRINRTILYMLLNINNFYHNKIYLRILGTDNIGLKYINTLNKEVKKLIFSSVKEINSDQMCYNILEIELLATKLYSLITNNNELIIKEYQLPIRKD
ncbi:MAG: nucleotidyltransferase family protein [Erysipelotrichaceae bacterium]|nr:nucleotidyltransferase family protein [Erysipelotrichaceae bacterium]